MKKELTDKEKIDKFLRWLKKTKDTYGLRAEGGGSSWNWSRFETMETILNKAKEVLK